MGSNDTRLPTQPGTDFPFRTPGEWAAHLRWRNLVVQKPAAEARVQAFLGGRIDRIEAKLFGPEGATLADRTLVASMAQLGALARARLPVEGVLEDYRQLGHPVRRLHDVRGLSLDDIERGLLNFDERYLMGASMGGALTGAFGALGVIGSVPSLILGSLHAINRLALYHGHDPRDPDEQQFALLVLASSLVARPTLRGQVLGRLQAVARELEAPDHGTGIERHAKKITENVAESLMLQLILGLATRSFPLAGLVLGASYSRAFVSRACDTARAAYGQRALLRRYGDNARVEPNC